MKRPGKRTLSEPAIIIKILYTLFVLILIPIWWTKLGPINFLWFSDIALFLTVISLWQKNPLINSMMFLSVVLFESVWTIDVSYQLITGNTLVGLAAYMFDPQESTIVKIFSGIFHVGMPLTIIYLMKIWGYDRRAWRWQSLLACVVLVVTYFAHPKENINWVRGVFGKEGNTFGIEQPWFLMLLIIAYSLLMYLPVHLLMKKLVRPAPIVK